MPCSLTNSSTVIPELGVVPASYASVTECHDSCGCLACFCFFCGNACQFLKVYAVPINDDVQEIYKCSWNPVLPLKLEVIEGHKYRVINANLTYDGNYKDDEIELGLISATNPPFDQLASDFIATRNHAAGARDTIAPTVHCHDASAAPRFQYSLTHNPCGCYEANEIMVCRCPEADSVTKAFEPDDKRLPLFHGNIMFDYPNDVVTAKALRGRSELQLSLRT